MPLVRLLHDGREADIPEAELRSLESQGFGWEPLGEPDQSAGRPGANSDTPPGGGEEGE